MPIIIEKCRPYISPVSRDRIGKVNPQVNAIVALQPREALLAEATKRGGPTQHTYKTVPGELNGRYAPGNGFENWYSMMLAVQLPTVLRIVRGAESGRAVGWHREQWEGVTGIKGLGADLPLQRPGSPCTTRIRCP